MQEGTFRLFRTYPEQGGSRLVARFSFTGTTLQVLEDHDGIMDDLVPGGKVSSRTLQRLESMATSPYWRLVSEEDIQSGEHDDLLPEMQS
jgi:hypothetical protein